MILLFFLPKVVEVKKVVEESLPSATDGVGAEADFVPTVTYGSICSNIVATYVQNYARSVQ